MGFISINIYNNLICLLQSEIRKTTKNHDIESLFLTRPMVELKRAKNFQFTLIRSNGGGYWASVLFLVKFSGVLSFSKDLYSTVESPYQLVHGNWSI